MKLELDNDDDGSNSSSSRRLGFQEEGMLTEACSLDSFAVNRGSDVVEGVWALSIVTPVLSRA